MQLLTIPRSQPSSPSPATVTTAAPDVERTPPPSTPTPTPTPRTQGLKFFRTFSTRSLPSSSAEPARSWETSPRRAARALRGWFRSPPSPRSRSSKAEDQAEYKWKHLDEEKDWDGFLRGVEDAGGFGVPPLAMSPTSLRRAAGAGEENEERRRRRSRSGSKSSDWDAAMVAHARSLGYSCPSSPSDFGSNRSRESLASGSSGSSSAHTPSMSVFSPSIRAATHYRPMRSRAPSYSGGRRETRGAVTSEDFVLRYFAADGAAEASMPKPKRMRTPIRNEGQSPSQQNALQLVLEAHPPHPPHPRRPSDILRPAEPILGSSPPSETQASPRSPQNPWCPLSPSPPRTRSPARASRPSPLRPRSASSVDGKDNKRSEQASTDLEALRIRKGKRRRNTTGDLTTIWETPSHREEAVVDVYGYGCNEAVRS